MATTRPTVAVIPPVEDVWFWRQVEMGAKAVGARSNAEVIWEGPATRGDHARQVELVDLCATRGVGAIILGPADAQALRDPVREAAGLGVPVVIVSGELADTSPGKDYACYVGTDEHAAGLLAGRRMGEMLGGRGKVVMVQATGGSSAAEQRQRGFVEAMGEHPGLVLLVIHEHEDDQVQNVHQQVVARAEDVSDADGLFAPSETTTLGLLLAFRELGLNPDKVFVGVDAGPALIDGLRDEDIDALLVRQPRQIGAKAMAAALALVEGGTVSPTTYMDVVLVTPDNVDSEAVQRLLD